jgi:8-oxo-dGTP diphosphatase
VQVVQKAVLKAGEKYLILFRSNQVEIKPSCWDFPGGRLQDGEDPETGLMREVKEEIGQNIKVLNRQANYQIALNGILYYFVIYNAKMLDGEEIILSSEHSNFRWSTKKEMENLELHDFLKKYLEDIKTQ